MYLYRKQVLKTGRSLCGLYHKYILKTGVRVVLQQRDNLDNF